MSDDKCSICKYPDVRQVKGDDGKMYSERLDCLDHIGVLPYLWNRHKDHPKHETFRLNEMRRHLGKQRI